MVDQHLSTVINQTILKLHRISRYKAVTRTYSLVEVIMQQSAHQIFANNHATMMQLDVGRC